MGGVDWSGAVSSQEADRLYAFDKKHCRFLRNVLFQPAIYVHTMAKKAQICTHILLLALYATSVRLHMCLFYVQARKTVKICMSMCKRMHLTTHMCRCLPTSFGIFEIYDTRQTGTKIQVILESPSHSRTHKRFAHQPAPPRGSRRNRRRRSPQGISPPRCWRPAEDPIQYKGGRFAPQGSLVMFLRAYWGLGSTRGSLLVLLRAYPSLDYAPLGYRTAGMQARVGS